MSGRIKSGSFVRQVEAMIANYSDDVKKVLQSDVADAAKDSLKEIKKISPKGTGKYSKDWKSQFESTRTGGFKIVLYNGKRYRLTHLLEFGHAKVNGGRTSVQPHVSTVQDELDEKILRILHDKLGG